MSNRRMASFTVSPPLLEEALTLPDGHRIVGAEWDFAANAVRLYVEGPGLPEVEPGAYAPSVVPVVTVSIGDDGRRAHTWRWSA